MFGIRTENYKRWVLSFCCALALLTATTAHWTSAVPAQDSHIVFAGAPLPQEGGGDGFTG